MTDAGTQAEVGLPDSETVAAVQEALIEWYEADHREYPWRQTDDPYEILVSEIMSQQTQLDRVVEAWSDFLDEWPTVEALADAARGDVVAFWSDTASATTTVRSTSTRPPRRSSKSTTASFPRHPPSYRN